MGIGVVDRKLLWGRSRNECAYPSCRQALTVDLHDPESDVLRSAGAVLGEEAHIRSSRPQGPRYDATFDASLLDTYQNLLLLCPTHHALIDKDGGAAFTVGELICMRTDHEAEVRSSESREATQLRAVGERVAAAVQVWEECLRLDDWQGLTWGLNLPISTLKRERYERLHRTGEWLLAKTWPTDFPMVRHAFMRHHYVLSALLAHVSQSFEPVSDETLRTRRRYKDIPWNPELYGELLAEHQLESSVTWWLTLELTRSANLVIEAVRAELDPLYRFEDGILLMRDGDGVFVNQLVRVEYRDYRWTSDPRPLPLECLRTAILTAAAEQEVTADEVDLYAISVPSEAADD